MSANLRRKLNQQQQDYARAVFDALASDDTAHVSSLARVLRCPVCGRVLACPVHARERYERARVSPLTDTPEEP